MKMKYFIVFITVTIFTFQAAGSETGKTIITDFRHYSNVFGEMRNVRIFLPPSYYDNPGKRYPVIYFYHGWSQRYFGSINHTGEDEGESNNGDNIASFVETNDVIVVKPDGYNRKPDEEYYLRPYNVSPVETYRQFPLYFPELIEFIDANYRTFPDREHRAISGLSMGGFMTFWISGKYPHLVSAAGSFCGSPEFFVGPQEFPSEYRHIDMAKNYKGVNVRLNYGNMDFIRCYHRDLNKVWPGIMNNYEYKIYEAEHTTCGLGEMFDFFMRTFADPPDKPEKWEHIDVYPSFEVWDYFVDTNRDRPGFTIIENVDNRGFKSSVREFLSDGELMSYVKLSVLTAPIYDKNQLYIVKDFNLQTNTCTEKTVRSNDSGRIKIDLDGGVHEIGINKIEDKPNLCCGNIEITNQPWAVAGRETRIKLSLLNKGMSEAVNVKAVLSPFRNNVNIIKNIASFGNIAAGNSSKSTDYLSFSVIPDTIEIIKLKLLISDDNKNEWPDYIEIPVRKDPPNFFEFEIADGRLIDVASSGTDTTELFLGNGNGDGIANPGESIVILVKDQGLYRRTELFSADPYINQNGINERQSDDWTNYDYVGGSAKYSVPLISSDCPDNHTIEFVASYWLPAYPDHIIKYGKISVTVSGQDNTPPEIRWINVTGDNTVQVKVKDGTGIKSAKARFTSNEQDTRVFEIDLNDEGKDGDMIKNDNLFSGIAPIQNFGLFSMEIEVVDIFENKTIKKFDKLFVFQ